MTLSRGDEEIIDDALDMLAWQRREIARLREALDWIAQEGGQAESRVARAALGDCND